MGQKVCPTGFRLGITEEWRSQWYARKKDFGFAGIPIVEIDRTREEARVTLHTARPGLIIGRKGAGIDKLKEELEAITGRQINIKIKEVDRPELSAQLIDR